MEWDGVTFPDSFDKRANEHQPKPVSPPGTVCPRAPSPCGA